MTWKWSWTSHLIIAKKMSKPVKKKKTFNSSFQRTSMHCYWVCLPPPCYSSCWSNDLEVVTWASVYLLFSLVWWFKWKTYTCEVPSPIFTSYLKVSDEAFFQKQSYSIDTQNCSRIAENRMCVCLGRDCCLEKPLCAHFCVFCVCASLWGNLSSILLFRSS